MPTMPHIATGLCSKREAAPAWYRAEKRSRWSVARRPHLGRAPPVPQNGLGAAPRLRAGTRHARVPDDALRSEEHTSELQSHSDLVCRLLLEKKKKKEQKT